MAATETVTQRPIVSVVVPARNEEVSLGDCLRSLVTQTGIAFEIIVVDDHSSDRTREIAASFHTVRLIDADPLRSGWTGKNNALANGARQARGEWLLFTDADTIHLTGSLAASVKEAQQYGAALLSYSPEQIVRTFSEKAVMPVVFAELARQFRPKDVSDPASPVAAANGQYILIAREAYDAVGGHAALAIELLEDVALARAVKKTGRRIFFRYAADRVRTRMYRSFVQLREGWTKNLALLFPSPRWLALRVLLMWLLVWASPIAGPWAISHLGSAGTSRALLIYLCFIPLMLLMRRVRRANFSWDIGVRATLFGPPIFAYLLLRSDFAHKNGKVTWKDRSYGAPYQENPPRPSVTPSTQKAATENRELRTGN
jgi:glycosyltransferase involved in cell wall biosynthesis